MPVWANTGTFTVTPSASFQNDGFNPTLPFPVEFLNWKLNELDMGGYFEHAQGTGSDEAHIRGGDTSSGGNITQVAVGTDSLVVSTFSAGTLEAPSGTETTLFEYDNSSILSGLKAWTFTSSVQAVDDILGRRWGYSTGDPLIVECHLADDASLWSNSPAVTVLYETYDGSGFNNISLLIDPTTTNALLYISLACLGNHNTESPSGSSNLKITGFSATGISTDSSVTAEVSLLRKPRDGTAATILTNGGAVYSVAGGSSLVSLAGTQPSELVQLDDNAYFLRIQVDNSSGATAQMSIRDIKLTLTKYAVE